MAQFFLSSRLAFALIVSLVLSGAVGVSAGRRRRPRDRDPVGPLRHPAHLRAPTTRACSTPTATPRWRRTPSCCSGSTRRRAAAAPSSTASSTSTPIAGCAPTASRHAPSSGRPGRARSSRRSSRAFVDGLNALGRPSTQTELSAAAKAVLPLTVEDVYAHCLRVIHYDWIISPSQARDAARRADAEVHGSNEWAIAPSHSASGQGDAAEQLAPAVGRHPHLLRSAAHRARRHVVRRRLGRLPGAAPVLQRLPRLDADDEQPG